VAIDSEVRLKDGKAVSVKQPLPLPQGVSDLAVGGQLAGRAIAPAAAPAQAFSLKRLMAKEEAKSFARDESAAPESEPAKPAPIVQGVVKLQKVIVPKGISEQDIKQAIEAKLYLFEDCYNEALKKVTGLAGTVVLKVVIDKTGAVKTAIIDSSTLTDVPLEKCILEHVKQVSFPTLTHEETAITVTLKFSLQH
jgi:Ca-activated chloride channel family protein